MSTLSLFRRDEHRLVKALRAVHRQVCEVAGSSDQTGLGREIQSFKSISLAIQQASRSSHFETSEIRSIRSIAMQINTLASSAIRCHATINHLEGDLSNAVLGALQDSTPVAKHSVAESVDEFRPWKDYFLDNISWPYADGDIAATLAAQVPGMDLHKFRTWLINNRRRTGWMDIFNTYAGKDEKRMRLLFEQHEDEHLSQLMPIELYDAISKVKTYHAKMEAKKVPKGEISEVVQAYKGVMATPARRTRESSAGSSTVGPSSPESCGSVSLRSSSGSSTSSSPYYIESPYTPAPITGKRSRDEDDIEVYASVGKKAKQSLYDQPNRPSSGANELQQVDLFHCQRRPSLPSVSNQLPFPFTDLPYSLPSFTIPSISPREGQFQAAAFSLPPIATLEAPWLSGSETPIEQSDLSEKLLYQGSLAGSP